MEPKFKIGDTIESINRGNGFEKATVIGYTTVKDRPMYKLKIMCGTATIPVTAQVNYRKIKNH